MGYVIKGDKMEKTRIAKDKLLTVLRKNKEEHRSVFLEALEGYKKEVIKTLEDRLMDAKSGKKVNVFIALKEPVDQTKDYDRIIKMLEMSIDTTIELSEHEFSQYVLDDWSWKNQFISTNATYSKKASDFLNAF